MAIVVQESNLGASNVLCPFISSSLYLSPLWLGPVPQNITKEQLQLIVQTPILGLVSGPPRLHKRASVRDARLRDRVIALGC